MNYVVLTCRSGDELDIKQDYDDCNIMVPLGIEERYPRHRKSKHPVVTSFVLFTRFVFVKQDDVLPSGILSDRRVRGWLRTNRETAYVKEEELERFKKPIKFGLPRMEREFFVGQHVLIRFLGVEDIRARIIANGFVEFTMLGNSVQAHIADSGLIVVPLYPV